MSELIRTALAAGTDTRTVVLRSGAVRETGATFAAAFPGAAALVVGDERTLAVAGAQVTQSLQAAGVAVADTFVFPGSPELYARYENCVEFREALAAVDAVVVAVGAGTLNDIAKRASGELGRPYLVVGTAASMDGYTAFGASISRDGYKQTLACPAPRACIVDLDLIAAAPAVMTASGYGDLIGKVPAGADWMLADALGVEAVDPQVWALVQGPLRPALSRPEALRSGEPAAIEQLAEGLVMSGLAMQAHRSSRPASGAEHQFSHLWEMEGHGVDLAPRRLSHGFKVGIGAVAIAALYDVLLRADLTRLDVGRAVAAWPDAAGALERVLRLHPADGPVKEIVPQAMAKYVPAPDLAVRLERLAAQWGELSAALRRQLMPAAHLQELLEAVGAPSHPRQIGLDWNRFHRTYARAQTIRSRYTVLDVVLEAGLLDGMVEELFAADGFWGAQAG